MKPPSRVAVFTSMVAGQLAGLTMAMTMMGTLALVYGRSPLFPLQVMSALLLGDSVLTNPTPGALAVGFLAHQTGPTLFWSRLLGFMVGYSKAPIDRTKALLFGLLVGTVAQVIDIYVVMGPSQQARNGHNIWAENVRFPWDWVGHLVFGLSMGLFYLWLQPREPQAGGDAGS
ncbi:MAG: hypothetical protein HY698_18485 [Deltaproteobacteria bacterium]|nr:hypothetical protein [Deltaproteobacteria bacterium]